MKIGFLTTDEPLYLPAFFERVLDRIGSETLAVYACPPLYKNQSSIQAALRYRRTFGTGPTVNLIARVLRTRVRRQSIAQVCRRRRVQYVEVEDVNSPSFLAELGRQSPDVLVSVSCPQIFKRPLIELPAHGILNIHGAILPHYRGVLPSFWMMANGEKEAGVSIYIVNEKIDAGALCAQKVFPILPEESLDEFIRRSKQIAADLLLVVLEDLKAGKLNPSPLDLSAGSYYSWPDSPAVERFRANGRRLW